MKIQQGYSYHIKDKFFNMVQDKYLMGNKENRNYMEKETTPSQSEWLIMEVFWACSTSLTAREVCGQPEKRNGGIAAERKADGRTAAGIRRNFRAVQGNSRLYRRG